jgi:hypothetical protein
MLNVCYGREMMGLLRFLGCIPWQAYSMIRMMYVYMISEIEKATAADTNNHKSTRMAKNVHATT